MKLLLSVVLLFSMSVAWSQEKSPFSFTAGEKRIELRWKGRLLTAYRFDDSVRKPFLYPVNTVEEIPVTRGFPLQPRAGERTDHPHHTGLWQNYESVNGLDFWNNSTAIAPERRHLYGTIRHKSAETTVTSDSAILLSRSQWLRPNGRLVMNETTRYRFTVMGNRFFILRESWLAASSDTVFFKDVKDGFLAIRLARELEMPSTQKDLFILPDGGTTKERVVNNEGTTGLYQSSRGLAGDSVWSSRANWVVLRGRKESKDISVSIFDHPSNVGFPAYWHARGYGLFAVNPFGQKVFSNGREELNFKLLPGQTVHFRYLVMIASEGVGNSELEQTFQQFAGTH